MSLNQSDYERLVNSYSYAAAILKKHLPGAKPYRYPRLMDVLAQIDKVVIASRDRRIAFLEDQLRQLRNGETQ